MDEKKQKSYEKIKEKKQARNILSINKKDLGSKCQ